MFATPAQNVEATRPTTALACAGLISATDEVTKAIQTRRRT